MAHRRYVRKPPRPGRRAYPKRPRRRRSFGLSLAMVVAGGFVGTLGALNMMPGGREAAAGIPLLREGTAAAAPDTLSARFGLCHSGGGRNCVVDGDTFWFEGQKYRVADIDTPETHPARCAEEAELGEAATGRLLHWLNAGAFTLESVDRDTDRYDRKLRIVTRGGDSVGDMLVDEGLARRWEGRRRPWC